MMTWIIDNMIMKGSCLTVGKWKYLQRVTFSCDWSVRKFRLRGEIKWRSLRSEGVGASCRWDHSSCLESFIYRAMDKPWHSQEPFRLWALVMGGTASPFSQLPILQILMMAYVIFCCNVHVTIVEGDLKELSRSLVCILLSIAQIAVTRQQFSPLLYIIQYGISPHS